MDTATLAHLRAELTAWERVAFGDPLAAHHRGQLARYLLELRRLTSSECRTSLDAVMMVALALGPRGALPGAGDLDPLLRTAVDMEPDALDLAVAWGCGWRRAVMPGHRWHGRWEAAILSLSSMVAGAISQTVRGLANGVPDFREALRTLGEPELGERCRGFCDVIALELAVGGCRCGHGSRAHRRSTGTCSRPEHRLTNWRPEVCRLPAFLAMAVRGSAQPSPRSGAFATSMLAGLLRDEHLLRVGVAEFRVCHGCNGRLIELAVARAQPITLSSVERGLYDVSRCPGCDAWPDPGRTYHIGRKHWLIVPAEWGGGYQPAHRYRCGGCGSLFEEWRDHCPLCGWTARHRDRPTTVWVRRPGLPLGRIAPPFQ